MGVLAVGGMFSLSSMSFLIIVRDSTGSGSLDARYGGHAAPAGPHYHVSTGQHSIGIYLDIRVLSRFN